MLTEYIRAAMNRAVYERLEDDESWYGEIPGLAGVWANATSRGACVTQLQEVLEEWIALGLTRGDKIPEVDGHRLAIAEVA